MVRLDSGTSTDYIDVELVDIPPYQLAIATGPPRPKVRHCEIYGHTMKEVVWFVFLQT